MKKLFITLLFPFISISQTYEIGLVGDYSVASKLSGTLTITDTKYTIVFGDKTTDYDVVTNRNGIVYITDGVMTDWIQVSENKGKKKGFEYSKIIYYHFDDRRKINTIVLYYCK